MKEKFNEIAMIDGFSLKLDTPPQMILTRVDGDKLKAFHRQSLITFVEAQIEMLEGMRMKWPEPEPLTICIADGYNQALTDIITEYKEFLKEIKE